MNEKGVSSCQANSTLQEHGAAVILYDSEVLLIDTKSIHQTKNFSILGDIASVPPARVLRVPTVVWSFGPISTITHSAFFHLYSSSCLRPSLYCCNLLLFLDPSINFRWFQILLPASLPEQEQLADFSLSITSFTTAMFCTYDFPVSIYLFSVFTVYIFMLYILFII